MLFRSTLWVLIFQYFWGNRWLFFVSWNTNNVTLYSRYIYNNSSLLSSRKKDRHVCCSSFLGCKTSWLHYRGLFYFIYLYTELLLLYGQSIIFGIGCILDNATPHYLCPLLTISTREVVCPFSEGVEVGGIGTYIVVAGVALTIKVSISHTFFSSVQFF